MQTVLYDVRPTDVATYASVVLVLIAAAIVASVLPAWRAARVNPLTALRTE
jgi:ABC-type lipoprotein release transport system permease subunit